MAVARRDLRDSQSPGLSDDWRLNIAYNAALQLATAALAASGFRAAREAHHYRIIQSLAFTIGTDAATVHQLDAFRRKRNQGEYEQAGVTSAREAQEMIALASGLYTKVEAWLAASHANLLPAPKPPP